MIFKRFKFTTSKPILTAHINVKSLAYFVNKHLNYPATITSYNKRERTMFDSYKKQNDVLEKFRIKAHLRSYVKDPIVINETLLQEAVEKLKKLPYQKNDPTDSVARDLVLEAYRSGYFKYDDLTDDGCKLVRLSKYRRHPQLSANRASQTQLLRNRH